MTDLTPYNPPAAHIERLGVEQVELLKRTICKGSTDDEFALFVQVCNRTQLDPFARQIHAVKRWDNTLRREVMTIQTGIDGLRLIAHRTGRVAGTDGPYWCGPDGTWHDVWLGQGPPAAAKVIIYRTGITRGFAAVALYSEYVQTTKDGAPTAMWRSRPAGMLAKCAEALALRMAFPADMAGVYADEEIPPPGPSPEQAPATIEAAVDRVLGDYATVDEAVDVVLDAYDTLKAEPIEPPTPPATYALPPDEDPATWGRAEWSTLARANGVALADLRDFKPPIMNWDAAAKLDPADRQRLVAFIRGAS